MKTYEQAELDRLIEMKSLIGKLKIDALNIRNATPMSNRSLLHFVITKKMIEDAKKGVDDCDMYPAEEKKFEKLHKSLMNRMNTLFIHEPRLKKICKDQYSQLVVSCFTQYTLRRPSNDNDLKYVLQFCGYNLTRLNVTRYPFSQIMPLINKNCPGLEALIVRFENIKDEDFKNVFSNMHNLQKLSVTWKREKSTLPMTLVKSIEKVGGTLKELILSSQSKDGYFLPDSLAPVLSQLTALERLCVHRFRLSQPVIQSIGKTKNLTFLQLLSLHDRPMMNEQFSMSPIGNLKNLESLNISWDCDDTDELLINLCDNAKKLKNLDILGTNITDNGMIALKKLSQLQRFCLGLNSFVSNTSEKKNEYITDKSIQCLFNEKLKTLDLSNCSQVSNKSVIKLFENLPNLSFLKIRNTNVTIEIVEELSKLTKFQKEIVQVKVSFKDCDGIFKSLLASHNIEFDTPRED